MKTRSMTTALAVSFGLLGGAAIAENNWSMATSWGGGPPLETAAKGFAEMAEFLTNGDVKIEVFPGGTLGSPLKVTETVPTLASCNNELDWQKTLYL